MSRMVTSVEWTAEALGSAGQTYGDAEAAIDSGLRGGGG